MKNILIVSGHTDLSKSVANKQILETLHEKLPSAEIVKLDSEYPDYKIDSLKEQERIKKADIIVLVYPFFCYSAPAIVYRWLELTFVPGFAYDLKGGKLQGKKLLVSVTSGAPNDALTKEGALGHTIEEYMLFIKDCCRHTGIEYEGIMLLGDVSYHTRKNPEIVQKQKEKCIKHAEEIVKKIEELSK